MWLSKLLQLSPRSAASIWWEKLLNTSKTISKTGPNSYGRFNLKTHQEALMRQCFSHQEALIRKLWWDNAFFTSGSFDETMLFTVAVSTSRRSSLIFLVVELTKEMVSLPYRESWGWSWSWVYLAKVKNFKDEKETIAIAKTPGHRKNRKVIESLPLDWSIKVHSKPNLHRIV